jgi:hypothetical protein
LAEAQMRQALDALNAAGMARIEATEPPRRAKNLSAMKDQLYDYQAVRAYLGVQIPRGAVAAEPIEGLRDSTREEAE